MCDTTQYVHYLSPSERGAVHDKKIAETYPIVLPQGSVLRQDTGFEGHRPKGVIMEQPIKKPKGKLLTFSQLIYNQMINAERVVIEHANSGIKRLRIVKDITRFHAAQLRDMVIVVACALHNLRVISPYRDY